jgi:hypothetical protein
MVHRLLVKSRIDYLNRHIYKNDTHYYLNIIVQITCAAAGVPSLISSITVLLQLGDPPSSFFQFWLFPNFFN